jgi:hypothetical protein
VTENEYTTMVAIPIAGPRGRVGIIDIAPPSFWLVYGKQRWLTEWHPWFGPIDLDKRTESPKDNQPGEKSMFWRIAVWWKNQGAVVVDGVGQWRFPPREVVRCRMVGNRKVIARDDGPDVFDVELDYIDDWKDGAE